MESRPVGESGVDVCFAGTLRCAEDVLAQFDCSFVVPAIAPPSRSWARREASSWASPWHVRSPGIGLVREGHGGETIPIERANWYRLELEDVCAAIRGEAAPLLGREDALGQARTIDALYGAAA